MRPSTAAKGGGGETHASRTIFSDSAHTTTCLICYLWPFAKPEILRRRGGCQEPCPARARVPTEVLPWIKAVLPAQPVRAEHRAAFGAFLCTHGCPPLARRLSSRPGHKPHELLRWPYVAASLEPTKLSARDSNSRPSSPQSNSSESATSNSNWSVPSPTSCGLSFRRDHVRKGDAGH